MKFISRSPEETVEFAAALAGYLKGGDIICLFGDLGSGKTTFVKGIAQGLSIRQEKVNSPTFVLMNSYKGKLPLFHFDFYRLDRPEEIAAIGYEEFLYGNGVAVIEWAERFGDLLPDENLSIRFSCQKENERLIKFAAKGQRYETLIDRYFDKKF